MPVGRERICGKACDRWNDQRGNGENNSSQLAECGMEEQEQDL